MIRTEHLCKQFGNIRAVDDLTLKIPKGEIFGFLGPNGAGKTTTIKLLTGLLKPTSGQVFICGYDIQTDYLLAKRLIGYVPDIPYLYEKLTGREFLNFIAELYSLDGSSRKIQEYFELFDLVHYQDHLIEDYSHGMRQKLVFAGVLLHTPEVIIVDEPLVGLDPKSSRLIKETLKGLSRQGVTLFISTHTLEAAEELCDRVGIIDKGRLITQGTIDELRDLARITGGLEDIFLELTK